MSRSRFACIADIGTELEVDTSRIDVTLAIGGIDSGGELVESQQATLGYDAVAALHGHLGAYLLRQAAVLECLAGGKPGELKRRANRHR